MKLSEILHMKGTYIFCPRCGSPAVTHTRPQVEDHGEIRTELYSLKCESCGMNGQIEENWFWKESSV